MNNKNFWQNLKKPIYCLAPLAGISDSPFRLICKEQGAEVVYSEMANATAIYYNSKKTFEMLKFSKKERPYVVQLFGHNPEHYAYAAKLISEKGLPQVDYDLAGYESKEKQPKQKGKLENLIPDGIDINLGCPAKKVFNNGSGVFLMTQPKLVNEIIKQTVQNTHLPVSIKVRAGLEVNQNYRQILNRIKAKKHYVKTTPQTRTDPGRALHATPFQDQSGFGEYLTDDFLNHPHINLLDFLKAIDINNLGIKAIMIHGRTYKQGFKGEIDFELIKKVKKYFNGIVIANGNIKDLDGAQETLAKTQADGVAIGTGVYGRPEIFSHFKTGKRYLSGVEGTVRKHLNYTYLAYGERGLPSFRKHLLWYLKGVKNAKKYYLDLVQTKDKQKIEEILNKINDKR
jgi:tRNA-dihydrouridine synthase